MALTTSGGNFRPRLNAQIVFGSKNEKLPVPNIRLYNPETKEASYHIPEGKSSAPINLSGFIKSARIFDVKTYTENDTKADTTSGKELSIILSDPNDAYDYAVRVSLVGDQPNFNGMRLLASIREHLLTQYDAGEEKVTGKEVPIQIGLYREPNKNKPGEFYINSIVRLPTEYDEQNNPVFGKGSFVRAPALPEVTVVKDSAGNDLKVNGKIVRDFGAQVAWVASVQQEFEALRAKTSDTEQHGEDAAQEEGASAEQAVAGARPKA